MHQTIKKVLDNCLGLFLWLGDKKEIWLHSEIPKSRHTGNDDVGTIFSQRVFNS